MSLARSLILTVVLSALAAGAGAWGGARYVVSHMHHAEPLHEVVHDKLNLSAQQKQRIAGVEQDYAVRRKALEAEMRAANADLARAIQQSHSYSPEVQHAVDRFHMAMGDLQKQSILHVLAMRQVLTPQQSAVFDETVAKALTEDAP
ncbi:Spy/CpxP family protein refolding chaperone [Phenylobacterium sp.]|uniref:Spy/CpxP family protein refolding chaperone n=1 Tax=Phenylobacterium sp. TaxID=1871053 RepID=UPI00356AD801